MMQQLLPVEIPARGPVLEAGARPRKKQIQWIKMKKVLVKNQANINCHVLFRYFC